jgi:hypothetical protein
MSKLPPASPTASLQPARPIPLTLSTLSALAICKQARETFDDLLHQAPLPTSVIHSLLRDAFKIAPLEAGLTIQRDGQHAFVNLANLAIYARSHTAVPDSQYAGAKVHKLPTSLGPVAYSPYHLLVRLARLDVPEGVRMQWTDYWQGRAAGKAVSRRHCLQSEYLRHVEASMALALAAGELTSDQFRFVTAALEDPEWKLADGKPVHIEVPSTPLGALVFSQDAEGSAVLYRPGCCAAFSYHASRDDLDRQLRQAPEDDITYQTIDDIAGGASRLLDQLLQSTLQALDHNPGSDLALHAPLALARVEVVEATRLNPQVFFIEDLPTDAQGLAIPAPRVFDFGSLSPDASPSNRAQQIDNQLKLLMRQRDTQVEQLQALQESLRTQCSQAEQASTTLLSTAHWHSDATATQASPLLVQAHQQGLRLHASIQLEMGQIAQAQFDAITALLDQGSTFALTDSDVAAAIPIIHPLSQATIDTPPWAMNPVIVVSDPATLAGTGSSPLLFYCLGEHGGLQNCTSLAELQECLGVAAGHESLELKRTSGDVLTTVLNQALSNGRAKRQSIQDGQGMEAVAQALPRIKEALLQSLQIPRHAAREAALELWQQQNRVLASSGAIAANLKALPLATLQALKHLAPHYTAAMRRAEGLLNQDLTERDAFCRKIIQKRLKKDFPNYDGSHIGLDLPRRVDLVTDIVQGGTPGTTTKKIQQPSAEREKLGLEHLLLNNIDEATGLRLNYLKLDLATNNAELSAQLTTSIKRNYLQTLAADLDLAKAYEELIRTAYRGLNDSDFQADFRRETLLAPLQMMLAMQCLQLKGLNQLTDEGMAIMHIAIHARSSKDYQADGHAIRLLPARLTAGGTDTDGSTSTISGVTFIEDHTTGITLLYLSEHKTQPLQQFTSLEAARMSLYERSGLTSEADYLANRALIGDPRAHASRILESHRRDFTGIIGVGTPWPATTSLAEHLLNAQMGYVIQRHRDTSRSNDDLWMENFTHDSQLVYTYIKLALGLLPFVGTAIAGYDFLDSAARATHAFIEGKITEGFDALNDALVALLDGALDLATGVGINTAALRKLTLRRQSRSLFDGSSPKPGVSAARLKRFSRFAGYEHDQPQLLDGLTAGTQGRYRAIYRHSSGDFIKIEHLVYQVEWDTSAHTWRLKGTRFKGWKRAIALDEAGNWNTHFDLYGTHLQGGAAGGGQALTRMADQLDDHWPAVVRNYLPRFLVDRQYRRYQSVRAKAYADEGRLIASTKYTNSLHDAPGAQQEAAYLKELQIAKQSFASWDELLNLSLRRNRDTPTVQKGRVAKLICDRLLNLIDLSAQKARERLQKLAAYEHLLVDADDLAQRLPAQRAQRELSITHLMERETMFKHMDDLNIWSPLAEQNATLTKAIDQRRKILNSEFRSFLDTPHIMRAAMTRKHSTVVAEYLLDELIRYEAEVLDSRDLLLNLKFDTVSAAQKREIYNQARLAYSRYKQRLESTYASMSSLFDETYLQLLYKNLDELSVISNTQLNRLPREARSIGPQPLDRRLFPDTDGNWYLGEFRPSVGGRPAQMVTRSQDRSVSIFEAEGASWRRQARPTPSRARTLDGLKQIATDALNGLQKYRRTMMNYQRQGKLVADIEDLYLAKAADLDGYANRLHELDPAEPQIARLRAEAQSLRNEGRTLRIDHAIEHAQPSEGHLEYLLEQRAVTLRRVGQRAKLKERDFLQEYEIVNARDNTVLWYAHFHYKNLETPFEQFSAAHIKHADHRYHGPQWQQQTGNDTVWRGPINRRTADKYFADL